MYTPPPGASFLIASTRLGSSAASIAFASIPQTYRHLFLLVAGQTTHTAIENVLMRFNGDSGNNYHWQLVQASNTTASGSQSLLTSGIIPGSAVNSTATSRPGSFFAYIPEYTQTNFHKTAITNSGRVPSTALALVQNFYGAWDNTAAITSIALSMSTGSFAIGTIASLYGMS